LVYPSEPFLAPVNPETRRQAKNAVDAISPGNQGTIISTWLDQARLLFQDEPRPDTIRHALLLTDGRNQHQNLAPRPMAEVLADCRSLFTCDALGIGGDWEPAELAEIARELQGTSDSVPQSQDLADVIHGLVLTAMSRVLRNVALRVRCATGTSLNVLEETLPNVVDIGTHPLPVDDATAVDYDTGPWGDETRHYVATLTVSRELPPAHTPDRLAVIELVTGALGTDRAVPVSAPAAVEVRWLDVPAPVTTDLAPQLERHQKERSLIDLRWEGGQAYREGRSDDALRLWSRARTLASQLRNEDALRRLRQVLEIDPASECMPDTISSAFNQAVLAYLQDPSRLHQLLTRLDQVRVGCSTTPQRPSPTPMGPDTETGRAHADQNRVPTGIRSDGDRGGREHHRHLARRTAHSGECRQNPGSGSGPRNRRCL
jgi:hypothetical protein